MRPFGGLRLKALAAPGLLLAGLVAGLLLAFPDTALKERVAHELAGLPVEVRIKRIALRPPFGVQAEDVTLRPQPGLPELTLDRATVRPLWLSLLGGNPGVAFRAERDAGELNGTFRRDGSVAAHAAGLDISLPLGDLAGLRLDGVLREGDLSGTFPPAPDASASLDLRLENAALSGLAALGLSTDALPLGTVTLQGAGEGNSFRFQKLSADGGDLQISGSGTVLLAASLTASRVNLDLTLTPDHRLAEEITDLLSLAAKPGPDGSYRLRLTGPLNAPTLR